MPSSAPQAEGARPRVLCFGEALVDRLFPPGIESGAAADPGAGGEAEDHLGGAPANVACALARLGTAVAFVGRLGTDPIGRSFAGLFADRGVDIRALQRDGERPSRVVLVRRDAGGDRSFGGFSGDRGQGFADQAVETAALAECIQPLLDGASWLLVGTIPLASPGSAEALEWLIEQALAKDVALALDVNWRPTFWGYASDDGPPPVVLERFAPLLEQASLIKCAAEEAEWLFRETDPLAIHAALPQRPAVLITDGPRPLRWCMGGRSGSQEAFDGPVVYTTGAGDAFTAGLRHGLGRRPELLSGDGEGGGGAGDPEALAELMAFASACGALVCQGGGAITPQPTEAEVERFLEAQWVKPD